MAGKPLDQLLDQTDPEGCHVTELPSRIWVFGGLCRSSEYAPASLRDAFWRLTMQQHPAPAWFSHLDRPEDNSGWLEHSGYSDLLEFERDACYLAKATVLFAESPGAYAELGAIAIDEALLPRLAIIIQHKHTQGESLNSFISLGPLRRVQDRVCVIGDDATEISPHDFTEIIDSLESWLPKSHKREKFQINNPTHRLLLIADIVDLLLISSEPDLITALSHFKILISNAELKKSLNLLRFLDFVAMYQSGRTPYWLRHGADAGPWIDYTAKATRFDRSRFKLKSEDIINSNPQLRSVYERGRR